MSSILHVTDSNFLTHISNSHVPVLVDFWAPWCGPCKMMEPILEDLSKMLGEKGKIFKLDVDQNPEKASEFGIRSIPTLILFKNGKVIETKVGLHQKEALLHWIQNA